MVTSVGGADEGKASDFPTRGGGNSGRRGDQGRSAKGDRPELTGGGRGGGERGEEQRREGERGEEHYLRRRWRMRNPNRSCRRRAEGDD